MQQKNNINKTATSTLSPEQMRAVLDNAVEGIITIDKAGMVLTFNRAAEAMFGYTQDEMIGKNVSVLMPSPYQEEHDGYLKHHLETGEKRIIGIGREVSGLRKNGEVFPLALSVGEAIVGEQITFAGIVRDMTEEKRVEQELKQKEGQLAHLDRVNLIGEMAAGIAHEVNQPLTAITTYAQACKRLLQSDKDHKADLVSVLDEVSAQVDRAGEVIRRIRAMAKGTQGQRERVCINDLIQDAMPLVYLNRDALDKNIELELGSAVPDSEIDTVQIQQVLLNLVRNALDVTDEGGTIIIQSKHLQDSVQVAVKDAGPGIDVSAEPHIYHPFFTTKKSESSGMGMGLTICQSILNTHNGKLWHEANEDTGTTFYFSLPVALETDS